MSPRPFLLAGLVAAAASPAAAQSSSTKPTEPPRPARAQLEQDAASLMIQLAASPAPTRGQMREALDNFLARYVAAFPAELPTLRARVRAGVLALQDFQTDVARQHFEAVLHHAPTSERDLRGRALYGRAQALEIAGDNIEARATLRDLCATHAGERYERFALVALERLQPKRQAIVAKARAPELIGTPPDLRGRSHRLSAYEGPVLLVFWSPNHPASIQRLRQATAAWRRGLGSSAAIISFALDDSQEAIATAVNRENIDVAVVPCTDEFVHPLALAYQVSKLPTLLVVGADQVVVGRDLGNTELEELARR